MSSPVTATTAGPRVEELVKVALKEALEKRRLAKESTAPSDLLTTMMEVIPETKVEAPKVPVVTLKSTQVMFSDLVATKVKAGEDFAVTRFLDYEWDERIASFVPEINNDYVINAELAASILMAWELNEKILCFGPTGAGKSSLIEQLCALTGRPFIRVNCTGDMDTSMIFGQLTAKDGSTIWVDGAVTEAVRYGAVFAWDEWDVTPPEISMGLQWLLEDDGKLFLKEMPGSTKDKQIIPHENFRIVAIGNTQGQGDETGAHAGTNVQNSATLDRFGTAVYIDYMAPEVEETMLNNKFADLPKKTIKELVKLANLIRQGYKAHQFSLTMSPRALFSICRKLDLGTMNPKKAFGLVFMNKLNETQHKVAEELFTKVFGKS